MKMTFVSEILEIFKPNFLLNGIEFPNGIKDKGVCYQIKDLKNVYHLKIKMAALKHLSLDVKFCQNSIIYWISIIFDD